MKNGVGQNRHHSVGGMWLPDFLLEQLSSITIYGRLSTIFMKIGLLYPFSEKRREYVYAGQS